MSNLAQFAGQSYLNLETVRKSGEAMPTPVWFVEEGGILYVRTLRNAGKVKRVRNTPRVRVMPCGRSGEPMGEWSAGRASIVDDAALSAHVDALLTRKYGLLKRMFDLFQRSRGQDVIRIELA